MGWMNESIESTDDRPHTRSKSIDHTHTHMDITRVRTTRGLDEEGGDEKSEGGGDDDDDDGSATAAAEHRGSSVRVCVYT
jgi:hypothetical protein